MTIRDELIAYANDCLSGKILSCTKHKWACKRYLRDLERIGSESFPYYWREEEAERIFKWFSYLRHSKGVLAGKPIILQTSQKFFICQLYGWRKADGRKRFSKAGKMIGRKNAKSQEQAGCLLYEISVEATRFEELYETYCAGVKRKQSAIIFSECRLMLRGSPLARKFKITRDRITHIRTDSFLEPLNKEDGKTGDGTNPECLVLDEYHQHPNTDFYDLALGGNAAQTLLIIITTAGKDLNAPCYQQEYKYWANILDPNVDIENDTYLVDIHEAEAGDDWQSDEAAIKANPIRMSYQDGRDKIHEALKVAQDVPEKQSSYMTKVLNIWLMAKTNGYMNAAEFKACEVAKITLSTAGCPVYVGLDMSAKIDLTSVSFIVPSLEDGVVRYYLWSHSFIPSYEAVMMHVRVDHAPYDLWERQGFITVTQTPIVDQNVVVRYVLDFCRRLGLDIQCWCFDPANATKMMIDVSDEGHVVEEVFQSARSLNESAQGFREQVKCKNVVYERNPVLSFAMHNAVVRKNDGLIKIDKDATAQRVDPVIATLCAFKLALYHEFGNVTSSDEWLDEEE